MNIARVPPPFGIDMPLQIEFDLQLKSCSARIIDQIIDVTLNHGNRR